MGRWWRVLFPRLRARRLALPPVAPQPHRRASASASASVARHHSQGLRAWSTARGLLLSQPHLKVNMRRGNQQTHTNKRAGPSRGAIASPRPCLCLRGATPLGVVCQRRGLSRGVGGTNTKKEEGQPRFDKMSLAAPTGAEAMELAQVAGLVGVSHLLYYFVWYHPQVRLAPAPRARPAAARAKNPPSHLASNPHGGWMPPPSAGGRDGVGAGPGGGVVPHLWTLWEARLPNEPILVGPSPGSCSCSAVAGLPDVPDLAPGVYGSDFRPCTVRRPTPPCHWPCCCWPPASPGRCLGRPGPGGGPYGRRAGRAKRGGVPRRSALLRAAVSREEERRRGADARPGRGPA